MKPSLPFRIGIAVLAFLVAAPVARGADQNIGFVLRLEGDWLINGKPVKQPGGSVPASSSIDLSPQTDFRSGQTFQITIIRLDNQPLVLSCNSFESCKKILPARAPASVTSSSSLLQRVEDAIGRLLSLNPDRYVPAISRGPGAAPRLLPDTVLELKGGGVDLLDWFSKIEAGPYTLAFDYVGRDSAARDAEVITFEWTPGPPGFVATPQLSPGLYSATLRKDKPDGRLASQKAWVLISDPGRYRQDETAFRQAVDAARQLQTADPLAAEAFLRAFLDDLAGKANR